MAGFVSQQTDVAVIAVLRPEFEQLEKVKGKQEMSR